MSDINIIADDEVVITIGGNQQSGSESDPTVPAYVKAITQQNITDWNAKADASAVTAEATARANADTALQTTITAEATARANADTTINNQLALCALKADSKIKALANDVASTTAAFIDATGIEFDLAANETFVFEVNGLFTGAVATGARLSFTIPSGAYLGASLFGSVNTNTAFRELFFPTTGGELTNTMWTTAGDTMFYVKGTIYNGATAGTFKLQFRCASAGNTVTLKKGSYIIAHKIQP